MLEKIKSKLIVSCQAPADSPIHQETIIAPIAHACVLGGAGGLRIDSPQHIKAVRKILPEIPLIGLWKRQYPGYEVYITPLIEDALAVAYSGADLIAVDATTRERPRQQKLEEIIKEIHRLGKMIMADEDSRSSAIAAVEAGADVVGTTLYGYTKATKGESLPGFSLLKELVEILEVPVICEGGVASPEQGAKALELGAYAVVVGTAITGIDQKVRDFRRVFPSLN